MAPTRPTGPGPAAFSKPYCQSVRLASTFPNPIGVPLNGPRRLLLRATKVSVLETSCPLGEREGFSKYPLSRPAGQPAPCPRWESQARGSQACGPRQKSVAATGGRGPPSAPRKEGGLVCPATRRAPILGDWGHGGGRSQPRVLSPVGAGWGQKGHKRTWPPLETAPGEGGSLLPKPQPQVSPCALCTPGVAICPAVGPCPSLTPVRPWPRLGCVLPRLRLGPASKGAPLCPARPHLPAPRSLPSVPSQARVSRVRPQAFSGTGISDLLRGPSFPFLTNPVSCVYPAALRRKLPQAEGGRVPQGRGPQWSGPTSSGGHRGSRGGAGGTGGTRSHRQARSLQQGDVDRAGQRAGPRRGDPC